MEYDTKIISECFYSILTISIKHAEAVFKILCMFVTLSFSPKSTLLRGLFWSVEVEISRCQFISKTLPKMQGQLYFVFNKRFNKLQDKPRSNFCMLRKIFDFGQNPWYFHVFFGKSRPHQKNFPVVKKCLCHVNHILYDVLRSNC